MLQGGPTSRLAARRDYAYRLFDAYAERARQSDELRRLELEHELRELFGERPAPEDRAVIRSRADTRRHVDEDHA